MKHLKLFESFQNVIYPDYFEWMEKLLPEEQLFLIFHSALIKGQAGDRFYKGASPAIEIEDETRQKNDPDDEEGYGGFTIEIICPLSGDEVLSVTGECTFSGGFSKFYPATREEPAEGGDYLLHNIDVEGVILYASQTDKEWTQGALTTDCFTQKELSDLINNYASFRINGEDERGRHIKESPLEPPIKLKEKIESMRNPETLTGLRLLNRSR